MRFAPPTRRHQKSRNCASKDHTTADMTAVMTCLGYMNLTRSGQDVDAPHGSERRSGGVVRTPVAPRRQCWSKYKHDVHDRGTCGTSVVRKPDMELSRHAFFPRCPRPRPETIGTPFIATPRRPGLSTISQQSTPAARERGDKIIKQEGAERQAAAFESTGPHAIGDKCRIDECNRRFW